MTARVLVVDDLFPNVKLLEARLTAEYYQVLTAMSGPEALAVCERGACDIVLLDVMMPGMDGFEVCRRIRANPLTTHLPVVMVTALDQPSDRVRGLDAGADDFLTKPIDEVALLSRVRSLSRLKTVVDELRNRATLSKEFGIGDPIALAAAETGLEGSVLIVDDRRSSADRLVATLSPRYEVTVEPDPQTALFRAAEDAPDVVLVSLGLENYDGLRLLSQLRSLERTRTASLLMITEPEDRPRTLRGFEIGVNDFLTRPVDRNELLARVRTQMRNKRFADRLRNSVVTSMELAVLDPLTGLYNRRYLDTNMPGIFEEAVAEARGLSVLVLDIDRFKLINDQHGHEAGDEVLRAFAKRVRSCVRGDDVIVRMGGEEIVVLTSDADTAIAAIVAERIRQRIEGEPFAIHRGVRQIEVTVSVGVATLQGGDRSGETIIARADAALYRAKAEGRNRVVAAAA